MLLFYDDDHVKRADARSTPRLNGSRRGVFEQVDAKLHLMGLA